MLKKILAAALAASMIIGSMSMAFADDENVEWKPFSDLKGYGWASEAIYGCQIIEAIAGYPDGTFKPKNNITGAEFVKVATLLGEEQEAIDKVEAEVNPNHWAAKYMQYAKDKGIVTEGLIEDTDWNKALTRQQMAVILENVSENIDGLEIENDTDPERIEKAKKCMRDYNTFCDKCKDKIVQAYLKGLIGGYSDGTFGAQKNATRAEAAVMLYRLIYNDARLTVDLTKGDTKYVVERVIPGNDRAAKEAAFKASYIDGYMGQNEYRVINSAKDFGFQVISKEDGDVRVTHPWTNYVMALNAEGDDIAIPDGITNDILGHSILECKWKDIAYFALRDSDNDITYICRNDF